MTIQICVSVPPKTINEAFDLIRKAEVQQADLIEIRLDNLKKHDKLADITHSSKTPMIATNKSNEYNGKFSGSQNEQKKILMEAAKSGFEYVDIELSTPKMRGLITTLREVGAKLILSFHDFNRTPEFSKLNEVLEEQIAGEADVCKIVTTAKHVEDNLKILDFVSKASKKAKIVCFAMGEFGKASRLLSPIFGAFFTFASLDEKRKTAKGQLTIQEMRKVYESLGFK